VWKGRLLRKWVNNLLSLRVFNVKTTLLFFATALCEILGCYLPWLWLKRGATPLLLIPAGLALMMFVWLLTLHPQQAGGLCRLRRRVSAPRCCGCVLSMALSLAIMTGQGR
jgi:hypothetical protein